MVGRGRSVGHGPESSTVPRVAVATAVPWAGIRHSPDPRPYRWPPARPPCPPPPAPGEDIPAATAGTNAADLALELGEMRSGWVRYGDERPVWHRSQQRPAARPRAPPLRARRVLVELPVSSSRPAVHRPAAGSRAGDGDPVRRRHEGVHVSKTQSDPAAGLEDVYGPARRDAAAPDLVQLLTPEGERIEHPDFSFDTGDGVDEDETIRSFYRDMMLTRRIDTEATAL